MLHELDSRLLDEMIFGVSAHEFSPNSLRATVTMS